MLRSLICDFCAGSEAAWRYPCESFNPVPHALSEGDWAACHACYALIEKGEWRQLAIRSSLMWFHKHPDLKGTIDPKPMIDYMLILHGQFAKFRLGPPTRI